MDINGQLGAGLACEDLEIERSAIALTLSGRLNRVDHVGC